jgi:hypothetical protein
MVSITLYYDDINGNNIALTGTLSNTGTTINGVGTLFDAGGHEISVGTVIKGSDGQLARVTSIIDDTTAVVAVAPSPPWVTLSCTKLYQQTFQALIVKGFDPVDDLEEFPGLQHPARDGSIVQQNLKIRRHIVVELGALQSYADRLFVGNFTRANNKYLSYTHDGVVEYVVRVVEEDAIKALQTEWLNKIEIARYVTLKLQEAVALTTFPS